MWIRVVESRVVQEIRVLPTKLQSPGKTLWVPQIFVSEIDRLTESIKILSENITNNVNDFEESLKHEASEMKQLLNEEVTKLKDTHEQEIASVRLEQQQKTTALTQEFKQDLGTKTETLKRQMDDMAIRGINLCNLTNTLSTRYNVLHASQVRTQYKHSKLQFTSQWAKFEFFTKQNSTRNHFRK